MADCRLICGDALEALRGLPAASVSAIVTDPPYGQTNEGYDKGVDPAVWRECFRVAKPNAALVSFAGSPTYHRIAGGIEAAGWRVRQMWAWVYRDGLITSAWPKEGFDRLTPAMDPICYATKGKVLLRVTREGEAPWRHGPRDCKLSARSTGVYGSQGAAGRRPRSVVAEDVEGFEYFAYRRAQADPDHAGHPNQKPLALMRWLLAKLPAGGVVLDPYAGSGTTLVAALAEGFSAVGIERDPQYFAVAERRVAEARADFPLFTAAGG